MSKELEQAKDIALEASEVVAKKIFDEIAIPALDAAVAKSPNKFDDVALAALKPVLIEEAHKLIDKIYVPKSV